MEDKIYKIFAAMYEDLDKGHIWIPKGTLEPKNQRPIRPRRPIAKITNGNESIHCEVLEFDENFLKRYSKPGSGRIEITSTEENIVVINDWYREKLGIGETNKYSKEEVKLQITTDTSYFRGVWACFDHPQVIVRIATYLAIIGLILGFLGMVLGAIGACPTIRDIIKPANGNRVAVMGE